MTSKEAVYCICGHRLEEHEAVKNNGCYIDTCGCWRFQLMRQEKPVKVNPVIVQLKRELAEARECELTSQDFENRNDEHRWRGYQDALRRAIEIVEKGK